MQESQKLSSAGIQHYQAMSPGIQEYQFNKNNYQEKKVDTGQFPTHQNSTDFYEGMPPNTVET